MSKLLVTFLILFFLPTVISADTIYLKDGTRWDVEKVWEEDGQIKCEMYGSIVSYPKKEVERVEKNRVTGTFESIEDFEKKISGTLKFWNPKRVAVKDDSIVVTLPKKNVTEMVFETIIKVGFGIAACDESNQWSTIKAIKILNQSGNQGYVFEGGRSDLLKLTSTKPDDVSKKMRPIGKSESERYSVMPFKEAMPGQVWLICSEYVALMHTPDIPSDEEEFKRECITGLNPNTRVRVIGNKGSWKEVFMINEENQPVLRGWILADTVKSAKKKVN